MNFIISTEMFWALFINFLPKFWSLSPYFRLMHWPNYHHIHESLQCFVKLINSWKKLGSKAICYWIKQRKHCEETVILHLLVSKSSSKSQRICCSLVFVAQVCDRFQELPPNLERTRTHDQKFQRCRENCKESPGFCSDFGCVLKLRITQSGSVDEYLCGVTVPIKYIYIVSVHSGSMYELII